MPMEALAHYFEAMPKLHRSLLLAGGLAFFFLLESAQPLLRLSYRRWRHAALNLFFTLTTVLVNLSLAFLLLRTSEWTQEQGVGALPWLGLGLWGQGIVGLLLLDLIGAWLAHFVEHRVKWMWRFHLIHHTDQHIDTTTANRHHPGESVIRFAFTLAAIAVAGAPVWVVFLYQSLSLVMTQFNHANIGLPRWLEMPLVWVLCTPDMHRVHHHYRLPYSDTNFGNIFSFWDRLFGTYRKADSGKLVYGVDTHMAPQEAEDLGTLLRLPFSPYRPPIAYEREEDLG